MLAKQSGGSESVSSTCKIPKRAKKITCQLFNGLLDNYVYLLREKRGFINYNHTLAIEVGGGGVGLVMDF